MRVVFCDCWYPILDSHLRRVNRALTSVNLSDNDIQAEGAKAVAVVLPQCKYVA